MKKHHLAWGALFLPACGGAESSAADATTDTASDTSVDATLDAVVDTKPDTFGDGSCGDGSCERSDVSIGDFPACPDCPTGWVCVHKPAGGAESTYCVRIPDCCGGVPSCECMGACACAPLYYRGCISASPTDIECDGPISVRAAKVDVRYMTDDERDALAAQTLSVPLATYRYRVEAPTHAPHLGFVIDDQPTDSFAVAADRTHVDLYGYASMLLATIQHQQMTIDELRERVARLEARADDAITPPRSRDRRNRSPRRRASTNRSSPR
jgi:hypothetical protein